MARRAAFAVAGVLTAVNVLAVPTVAAAATPAPLVSAECVGQGLLLTAADTGLRHVGRYTCASTRGAVLLDLSRTLQGAEITAGSKGQRTTQIFR
ncbi:hypothetical protein ACWD6P_28390 [Streptomyces sp. NPDC002446]